MWKWFIAGIAMLMGAGWSPGAQTLTLDDTGQWKSVQNLPEDLQEYQTLLEKGKAKKAEKKVKKWIKNNLDSEFLDQAYFIKGQSLFDQKLYYQSFLAYDELLDSCPGSPLFTAALRQQMEIARLFLAGKKRKVWRFIPASAKTEGLEILDRVSGRWPGSDLAASAIVMQADYYYNKKKYIEAQSAYQLIADNYTKCPYYQTSMLRNAETTYLQYNGPKYDTTCLLDARTRYLQYQARFDQNAAELKIPDILAQISEQLAEKEFAVADFYRRTHKIPQARFYWTYIIKTWPDSPYAQKSSELLQEHPENDS